MAVEARDAGNGTDERVESVRDGHLGLNVVFREDEGRTGQELDQFLEIDTVSGNLSRKQTTALAWANVSVSRCSCRLVTEKTVS